MISLIGIAGLILIAWLASTNRRSINLRTVGVAFAIQIGVGGLVLYFPLGKQLLSNRKPNLASQCDHRQPKAKSSKPEQ